MRYAGWQPRGKSLIELGAGCGLCGIMGWKLGCACTILTDQKQLLSLLERNVALNAKGDSENDPIVLALPWGSKETCKNILEFKNRLTGAEDKFDFVLVADCINPIYGDESWSLLYETIVGLCSEGTQIFLSQQIRGNNEALLSFLKICDEGGILAYKLVQNKSSVQIFEIKKP